MNWVANGGPPQPDRPPHPHRRDIGRDRAATCSPRTMNKDGSVFRFGQLYKCNPPDGPLDLFHNTCLVANQAGTPGSTTTRFRRRESAVPSTTSSSTSTRPRTGRSIRHGVPARARPSRALPMATASSSWPASEPPAATCWVLFRSLACSASFDSFEILAAYRIGHGAKPRAERAALTCTYNDSKALYPPGFERNSIDDDPRFQRIAPDGVPQFDDDLRLRADSPARGKGLKPV